MTARTFAFRAGSARCDIVVGEPLAKLPKAFVRYTAPGAKVAIVSDAAVAASYGRPLLKALTQAGFQAQLISVPSGEHSKTLRQAERIHRFLSRHKWERKSWLLALGGGMVGDLTGFVAATHLRGISFVQVPTTLLAQVDASIGGKTGVNIPEGKNLVGSFHQPRLVWIDPPLLRSLPKVHWRNGMAEVIKYAAIRDPEMFTTLEKKVEHLLDGYSADWLPIIARCAQIKAEIVQKDPIETKGLRALLNFGHSAGHAIEAATGYSDYLHGEAISIGMFVAGFLSQQMGLLEPIDRIRLGTLLTKAGLPSGVTKPIPRERMLEFLARDKKAKNGSVRFVLLKGIGQALSGQEVPLEVLDPALSASGL